MSTAVTLVIIPNDWRSGCDLYRRVFRGCLVRVEGNSLAGYRCGAILVHKDVDKTTDWYKTTLRLRIRPETFVFEFG